MLKLFFEILAQAFVLVLFVAMAGIWCGIIGGGI